jgi:hypothetical protein
MNQNQEQNQNPIFRYAGVAFSDGTERRYTYICDDTEIKPGDKVILPVGKNGEEKQAFCVSITESVEPQKYPFELKKIISKVKED